MENRENILRFEEKETALRFKAQYLYADVVATAMMTKGGLLAVKYLRLTSEDLRDQYYAPHPIYLKKVVDLPKGGIEAASIEQIDHLRGEGYAVPWKGISVEQQIEMGWIKIRDDE